MKPKTTILLALVLVLCIGYMAVHKAGWFQRAATPSAAEGARLSLLAEGVTREVAIVPASGARIVLVKDKDNWRLAQPARAPADSPKVQAIVTALETLQYARKLASDDKDAQTWLTGLDKPLWTVTLKDAKGRTATLKIGRSVPLSTAQRPLTYAAIPEDAKNVYQVQADLAALLDKSPQDLRSRTVLDLDAQKVVRLSVAWGNKSYEVAREKLDWRLTSPVSARADGFKVRGLVDQLAHLEARRFVDDNPKKYSQFGLDKPSMVVHLTLTEEGTPMAGPLPTSTSTSAPAQRSFVLAMGNRGQNRIYARLMDSPSVFELDGSVADQLGVNPSELRDPQVAQLNTMEVAGVTIKQASGQTQLSRRRQDSSLVPENRWYMDAPFQGRASEQAVGRLLDCVANLKAQTWIDDPLSAAARSFDAPRSAVTLQMELPIKYDTPAGSPRPVTILVGGTSQSGERTFVRVGDDKSIAVVPSVDVEPLLAETPNYWDAQLLSPPDKQKITQMTLTRPDGVLGLKQDATGAWQLHEYGKAPTTCPASTAGAIADRLGDLKAAKVVALGKAVPPKYNPPAGIQVALTWEEPPASMPSEPSATKAATASAPAVPAASREASTASAPGRTDNLRLTKVDGHTYAWLAGQDVLAVGEFDGALYDLLNQELHPRNITTLKPKDVQSLLITGPSLRVALVRQKDGWAYQSDPLVKVDSAKVEQYLGDLAGTAVERFIAPKAMTQPAGLEKPELTVEWTQQGPAQRLTVSSGGQDALSRFGSISGDDRILLLSAESVKRLTKSLKDFEPSKAPVDEGPGPGPGPGGPLPEMP